MNNQSFASWIRHPASITLIIALVMTILIMSEQSRQQPGMASSATVAAPPAPKVSAPDTAKPTAMPAQPASRPMGGELPRIVQKLGTPAMPAKAPSRLQAPDLSSLLGRLEDKVKSEPGNISNRLLLAQTYNELGLADKAVAEARSARQQAPEHARARLVLASILSSQQNEAGLHEAIELLKGLQSSAEIKQYLVAMYLGDASIRLGEHETALQHWKQSLQDMPVSDNRRANIEKRIADIASGAPEA
jgi:cytochrome c-type biogenesis protein CcmH/NrfG